jgi:uncharacterized coiled-coil protein SlyX
VEDMGTPDNNLNDIDAEIADLISVDGDENLSGSPDFFDLFEDEKPKQGKTSSEEDFKAKFPEIKQFEQEPKPYFNDADYYKKALAGEGAISQKVHTLLSSFIKTENPKDKPIYRERLIIAFWELASSIAGKTGTALPIPKKFLLRFGILLPTLINKDQRLLLSKIIEINDTEEPIYYVDEWLAKIARGEIPPSIIDETKKIKRKQTHKVNAILDKEKGHRDALMTFIKGKAMSITEVENLISEKTSFIKKRLPIPNFRNMLSPYSAEQKAAIIELQELSRKLIQHDKEFSAAIDNMSTLTEKILELEQRAKEEGDSDVSVDTEILVEEFKTVRQMAKMSVGRKGNHFPILMQQYMKTNIRELATRENIITTMAEIERIDPGLFKRTFKRQTSRILPYIIILPCYGEFGVCWEPFSKFNKATSKGRIAFPLYPKDLKSAIIYALGDLRWQVAKETASYYWMEEGLTGWYYQWFTDQKKRGDVKESFIADYFLWITKESDGMQKLDKEVRGIFWRNIPFPPDIKEKLRNRGFVYNELYKKDVNISMSDGY